MKKDENVHRFAVRELWERERDIGRKYERERGRVGEREMKCVCVRER